MIHYLLHTNVISELARPVPHPGVVAFVAGLASPILSVITIHELSFGAERMSDPVRKAKLIAWIASLGAQFVGRVIEVDVNIAEQAGRLRALAAAQGHVVEAMDALPPVRWRAAPALPRAMCATFCLWVCRCLILGPTSD